MKLQMKQTLIVMTGLLWLQLTNFTALSQSSKDLSNAERYYMVKNYDQAFPFFESEIKGGNKDPMVHYKAGICLQNSIDLNKQIKAIPYLEFAVQNLKTPIQNLHLELAELYLKNEELKKAQTTFSVAREFSKADKNALKRVEAGLASAKMAQSFMSMPRKFKVNSLGSEINSPLTEYGPVVSADESILAFTAIRANADKTSSQKFVEKIFISTKKDNQFTAPELINITTENNLGTAGISADGQQMIIFMSGINDPGNLFQIKREGNEWTKPAVLAGSINSKAMETTASITPDGKTIYFSSDRPGGKGGLDIYKTILQDNGTWSTPINLGSPINTSADEDAPFIHPDQKTLYFNSDGHNTMGGRDIFKATLIDGKWTKPENMGYPVNSTANDNYFNLLANGKRAYFSSDRKGGQGSQDIYYIDMPQETGVALTMLKGKILNSDNGKPMSSKIYLIDKENNKKLDFVYNPNPATGAYLIILPPAKNYDMVIESDGFLPYTLNINIPNQTYFYELYQLINLKTTKQFDVIVGQEVSVMNAFYDASKGKGGDRSLAHSAHYEEMLKVITSTDQAELEQFVLKIQTDLSISSDEINKNSDAEVATRTYFYDESDESKFEKKVVGDQVIFSLPTFMVTEEAKKQKEQKKEELATDKSYLSKVVKVYFDAGKTELKPQYTAELSSLFQELEKNQRLGIEISGFASAEGSEEMNKELSNKRAIAVLEFFNFKGIVRRRIVAKGYGANTQANTNKEENRRVEIRLVEISKL